MLDPVRRCHRSYHVRSRLSKDKRFFGLGPGDGRVPGESLTDLYLLLRRRSRNYLSRSVAGHASLVMQLPLARKTCLRVEALAVLEGVRQRAAGMRGFLSQATKDSFAGFLPPLQLRFWLLEIDYPGNVCVQAAALGAHHEHDAPLNEVTARNGMAVMADAVVGSC